MCEVPDRQDPMRVLVLGGHGFIGRHVVEEVRARGHEVTVASRCDGVDLLNIGDISNVLTDTRPDVVMNLAAHVGSLHYITAHAAHVLHDNAQMMLNLYRAVQDACPSAMVVNPLSNCSYPGHAGVQVEDEWWDGPVHESVMAYGNAKRLLYVLAKSYHQQFGLRSVNLIVANAFGPGDSTDPNRTHALNGLVIRLLQAQKSGADEFEIWGTGRPVREWVFVDDIAKILAWSLSLREGLQEPVNIAQGKGYSIRESAEIVRDIVGFQGELVFNTGYADGAPVKILDERRFRALLPDFEFEDHRRGIEKTVAYYQHVQEENLGG
jgi:GDP-L-fucose synthase